LLGRGFGKNSVRKILMAKNLDIKVFITKELSTELISVSCFRFDHDEPIVGRAQGQMSQRPQEIGQVVEGLPK
jgi:hypothetical protein